MNEVNPPLRGRFEAAAADDPKPGLNER